MRCAWPRTSSARRPTSPEADRSQLDRRIQAQMISTVQAEERIVAERAEHQRLEAAAEQRTRAIDIFQRNKETIGAMMVQFDTLMSEGVYNVLFNGGMGDIRAATQPVLRGPAAGPEGLCPPARRAAALQRQRPRPGGRRAGLQRHEFLFPGDRCSSGSRTIATCSPCRTSPAPRSRSPTTSSSNIPTPTGGGTSPRSGSSAGARPSTCSIATPRPSRSSRSSTSRSPCRSPNETPLDDVLKYIKQATTTPTFSGIPIYVDPIGLQEAERSLNSTVQIDLEGVPLKTTLRLILKQLGLAYTVKDGFMMITSEDSEDQQTEIRVYPVADLAIIPLSLLGGGGGGGRRRRIGGGGGGGLAAAAAAGWAAAAAGWAAAAAAASCPCRRRGRAMPTQRETPER